MLVRVLRGRAENGSLCIKRGLDYSGLEAVVQLVPQWLFPDGKAKSPTVQSMRLDMYLSWSSAHTGILNAQVLTPAQESLGSRIDELAGENEDKQAKSKSFLRPRHSTLAATRCGPGLGWVFSPQMG